MTHTRSTLETASAARVRRRVRPRQAQPGSYRTAVAILALALLCGSLGVIAGCGREKGARAPSVARPSSEPTSTVASTETSVTETAAADEKHARPGIPVRLRIPAIDVDAPVVPVGRDPDGHMGVPDGPKLTGWYDRRARPGERGSAVIAGHSGFRTGAAVFDHLGDLDPGDEVYVEDKSGQTRVFVVREHRLYDWDASVPEVFRRDDGIYLNLITCTGAWNPAVGTSSKRIVVFCDLKQQRPLAERLRGLIE